MLIYENTNNINFIALETANVTDDNNEILARLYENNVEINYTINEQDKVVHILYVEAKNKNKGCGTIALKEFLNDFSEYDIETESLFYLQNWYEKLGFKFQYPIDEMLCYKMKLEREF